MPSRAASPFETVADDAGDKFDDMRPVIERVAIGPRGMPISVVHCYEQ